MDYGLYLLAFFLYKITILSKDLLSYISIDVLPIISF